MKKIIGFITALFSFLFVFTLASCGSKSGVKVEESHTVTSSKITFNLTFAENENLSAGTAVPHIKKYAYDETATNHIGTYDKDSTVLFSNGVYTSSTMTFSGLSKNTTYVFRMYVTYDANEELLATWEITTSDSGDSEESATHITDKAGFLAMEDDPEGYYILDNDIDFGGDEISALFTSTSSQMFSGTFDGDGYTLSNFKISSSNTGLFAYTKGAVIKNLIIDGTLTDAQDESEVNADYSSGRATANVGILAGTADSTTFENIEIENTSIKIKGNTAATLNVGMVAGSASKCTFKEVHVENATLTYTDLRLKVCTGLFAGAVSGLSSYKEDGITVAITNCSAEGVLEATMHYSTSTSGITYVGGFIGDLSTESLVKDSYVVADIDLYRNETASDPNKIGIAVGGFAGANYSGSMNISGCAAIADISVTAGEKETSITDFSACVLTNEYAYISGFVGIVNQYINKIENSVYRAKTTAITVNAEISTTDDEGNVTVLIHKDNVIAEKYEGAKITNTVCLDDDSSFDKSVLADEVKAAVEKTYTAE